MTRVAGLHLAMAAAAVAVITRRVNGSCIATATTFSSRAPRGDERVADLTEVVNRAVCDPVLAVVARSAAGAADRLRQAVLIALRGRGIQVVTISAAEQLVDVAELWPTVEVANAGEAAALHLAGVGALQHGWPVGDRRGAGGPAVDDGPRNSHLHRLVKPFEEAD